MKSVVEKNRQLLVGAINRKIATTKISNKKPRPIDPEILDRALDCFESVDGAADWLVCPAFGLKGKIPVQVARTTKGKKDVLTLLARIDFGVLA
jgi:uncharacterized protein (DUF2384 family)